MKMEEEEEKTSLYQMDYIISNMTYILLEICIYFFPNLYNLLFYFIVISLFNMHFIITIFIFLFRLK